MMIGEQWLRHRSAVRWCRFDQELSRMGRIYWWEFGDIEAEFIKLSRKDFPLMLNGMLYPDGVSHAQRVASHYLEGGDDLSNLWCQFKGAVSRYCDCMSIEGYLVCSQLLSLIYDRLHSDYEARGMKVDIDHYVGVRSGRTQWLIRRIKRIGYQWLHLR